MSAIAGIISFEGAPADSTIVQRLGNAISPFGRDQLDSLDWKGGHFLRALLRTTPEDTFDCQPLVHEEANLLLLFDGRLDNREELGLQLGMNASNLRNLPDSALALYAVLRWGKEAPARFVGDFALACWQPSRRRLWLTRDAMGSRSLYWHLNGRQLAFSSSARSLLTLPSIKPAIDEARMHDHLCLLPQLGTESFFQGISRVEPGHVVEFVDGKQISNCRHQDFEHIETLKLARDEDYVDALDELMTRVTRAHLRSCTPISSQLSSGLDSSTVTAYAARALAARGERLTAYTAIPRPGYDGPVPIGRHADESALAGTLAARLSNIDHELVDVHGQNWLEHARELVGIMDVPHMNPCNSLWLSEINRRSADSASRVLLTGAAGNMTISYHGLPGFSQMIQKGHWLAWWREFQFWRTQGLWKTPIIHGVFPNLPATVLHALRLLRDKPKASLSDYSAISHSLKTRMESQGRQGRGFNTSVKNGKSARISHLQSMERGPYALHANTYGIERRDPTVDLRIVRFCLSVPENQYLRGGKTRWLLRRLIKDIVPPEVVRCRTRGLQTADWHEHLAASIPSLEEMLLALRSRNSVTSCININSLLDALHEWSNCDKNSAQTNARYRLRLMRGVANALFIARLGINQ